MRQTWIRAAAVLATVAGANFTGAAEAHAQQNTVTKPVTTEYELGSLGRALVGSNWRDVWSQPATLPVLNLDTLGGLTPVRTGGRQSRTLHFEAGNGHVYIFRSANKFLHREALPPDLRHTPVGNLVQDQISMLLPAPGLIVTRLEAATGVLSARPRYIVLPDDERLGEYREVYGGLVGQFEENPQEREGDQPGFGDSRKIVGTDKFFERIDESGRHRIADDEYLMTRLIDFMIGDTDRGGDQWRFALLPGVDEDEEDGELEWRPIPRDHDFAFMDPGGLFGFVALRAYPKLTDFGESWPSLRTLTFMTRDMDRRFLSELTRAQWDSVVTVLQTQLTDDVLQQALAQVPEAYREHTTPKLIDPLKWRRDNIREIADEFFTWINEDAEVVASDEAERAVVERHPDGSMDIRLFRDTEDPSQTEPFFSRRFMPDETREVRLHMLGGADQVRVTGAGGDGIRLRVIGGRGADEFIDAAAGGQTIFYAEDDDDRLTTGPNTDVRTAEFDDAPPGRPHDMKGPPPEEEEEAPLDRGDQDVGQKLSGESYRDFGGDRGLAPVVQHRNGIGIIIGAGTSLTRYGFRREPYKYQATLNVLYGIESRGWGAELDGDYRFESSPMGLGLEAHASQFESYRFFGFGNDTPDEQYARVYRDEVLVRPSIFWERDNRALAAGPTFRYGSPRARDETPFMRDRPYGSDDFAQAGVFVEGRIGDGHVTAMPWDGLTLLAGGSFHPAALDVVEPYGEAHVQSRVHVPIGGPFVALRAGAQRVWGEFPVHDAAFLGGRSSVRGYETQRFAGDVSLFGGAELHVPLGEVVLLTRSRIGAFGLTDAGRVWLNGSSEGGWHTAFGGGLTVETIDRVLTVTYAHGETGRLYVDLGFPF